MDSRETSEVSRSAWLTAVLLCLEVGGVLYAVFLFTGFFSPGADPMGGCFL